MTGLILTSHAAIEAVNYINMDVLHGVCDWFHTDKSRGRSNVRCGDDLHMYITDVIVTSHTAVRLSSIYT